MGTSSTILTQIDTAITAVTLKFSSGQYITEYREGGLHVKKESPVALLAELRRLRAEYAAAVAMESGERGGAVGCFGGSV
jgi:hypothetical protein